MKKILILMASIFVALGLIGCLGCGDKKPSRRAYIHQGGGYGMQYHIAYYYPFASLSHGSPCTKYEYVTTHMYMDHLGTLTGDEIVWKNFEGGDIPFGERGESIDNIRISIDSNIVKVDGLVSGYKDENGIYKIETTSPDSWDTPIEGK